MFGAGDGSAGAAGYAGFGFGSAGTDGFLRAVGVELVTGVDADDFAV